jgi:hypothetical protein
MSLFSKHDHCLQMSPVMRFARPSFLLFRDFSVSSTVDGKTWMTSIIKASFPWHLRFRVLMVPCFCPWSPNADAGTPPRGPLAILDVCSFVRPSFRFLQVTPWSSTADGQNPTSIIKASFSDGSLRFRVWMVPAVRGPNGRFDAGTP